MTHASAVHGRRTTALLAVLLLVLSACSRTAPPDQRFAEALDRTLGDSFAFEVLLEADQSALADLGEQAGGAAALLSGVRLHGIVDGDATQLSLDALGGTLIELRQVATADGVPVLFVRAGVVDLLAQVGVDDFDAEADLLAQLVAADAPAEVLLAVVQAFDGDWIGIEGGLGTGLGEAAGLVPATPQDAASPLAPFGSDLEGFLDRFVQVSDLDDGILHLDLLLGDLLRAAAGVGSDLAIGREVVDDALEGDLAGLPERVPGDVRVVDGLVEEMAFDVAAAVRADGTAVDGRIVVRIRITKHGTAGPVQAPAGTEPIGADVLDGAVAAILRAFGLA